MFSQGAGEAPRGSLGEQAALLPPVIQDLKLVREGEEAKAEEEKRLRLRKVCGLWSGGQTQGLVGCRARVSDIMSECCNGVTGS